MNIIPDVVDPSEPPPEPGLPLPEPVLPSPGDPAPVPPGEPIPLQAEPGDLGLTDPRHLSPGPAD